MNFPISALIQIACSTLLLLALTGGGLPLSTMHGPAPLPPNTTTVGADLAPVFIEGPIDEDFFLFNLLFGLYANGRYGITEQLGMGGSAGVFNGLTADVKYNLVRSPLFISADLAVSRGLVLDLFGDDDVDLWACIRRCWSARG